MLIVREMSKSSELYLIALSRDISERHATYYLNELAVSLKMMLISPRCVVLLNSYGILYIVYSLPLPVFMLYLNLNFS